jgi:hypothetical protein
MYVHVDSARENQLVRSLDLLCGRLNLASDLHDAPVPDPDVRDAVTPSGDDAAAPDGEIEAAATATTFADLR